MNTQDWALILFTILTEMSVGAFLVLGIVHYFVAKKAGVEEADRMSDRILIAIIVTLGLGMLASLLHLGNPLRCAQGGQQHRHLLAQPGDPGGRDLRRARFGLCGNAVVQGWVGRGTECDRR